MDSVQPSAAMVYFARAMVTTEIAEVEDDRYAHGYTILRFNGASPEELRRKVRGLIMELEGIERSLEERYAV